MPTAFKGWIIVISIFFSIIIIPVSSDSLTYYRNNVSVSDRDSELKENLQCDWKNCDNLATKSVSAFFSHVRTQPPKNESYHIENASYTAYSVSSSEVANEVRRGDWEKLAKRESLYGDIRGKSYKVPTTKISGFYCETHVSSAENLISKTAKNTMLLVPRVWLSIGWLLLVYPLIELVLFIRRIIITFK